MDDLTATVAEATERYQESLAERRVEAEAGVAEVRHGLASVLTDEGESAATVVDDLVAWGERATVATAGPRYFGFVIGGALPVALATDQLVSAWDQNAAMAVMSPLAAVAEEVAGRWLADLLGLPETTSVGFVTGGQPANTTCLAVARHHVLAAAGWDVEARGLQGAPRVHVVVGAERHATIDAACRVLGLGAPGVVVDADEQGRMRAGALDAALAALDGPTIVCAQAGNVVTGAFDPFPEIVAAAHRHGAWVHVDGAFGAWAAASPAFRHLTVGMAGADSWSVDGHKLLNVPYDSGYAFTAHPASHQATCGSSASYYVMGGDEAPRDGMSWVLDASRRARGVVTYAALRHLGRSGVADLVDRCCRNAGRAAGALAGEPGVEVLNDVVFNQVTLRFGGDDGHTRAVLAAVQRDGTCWAGGATWQGRAVMRLSVANWSTTEADIDRSVAAVVRCHRAAASPGDPS
ncbi:MAG TPA: aminotransferase class V-fold PLP-dependent enzyme [Acidimicrobiales bacterium]|nr:aminotransferase class V-fold PLP-dependent enzyme [Acidimicrobiales bacterium]